MFCFTEQKQTQGWVNDFQCTISPLMAMAGMTRDILGRVVLLWLMAGNSRWSCGSQGREWVWGTEECALSVVILLSYPSEWHHIESVLAPVDSVQEVVVADLWPGQHLQLTASTDHEHINEIKDFQHLFYSEAGSVVTFRWSDEPELEGTWRSLSFCAELSADERERRV